MKVSEAKNGDIEDVKSKIEATQLKRLYRYSAWWCKVVIIICSLNFVDMRWVEEGKKSQN